MKVRKLEKRADGVIRWLERMKSAYSSGAVESAYMDAECARADLEDLRSEFLRPKERVVILPAIARVIFLAMMIVMIGVMPLSRESVVIEPEPEAVMLSEPLVKPEPQPKKPRKPASKRPVQPAPVKPASKPKVSAPTKTVAYDKVYSLVQTGQRALRNDKSVIIK